MPVLGFIFRNQFEPRRHAFPDDCEIRIGRGAGPESFVVEDRGSHFEVLTTLQSLSSEHARVVIAAGRVTVEDQGSRNGTLVRLAAGVPHHVGDSAVGLGPDLTLRVENGRWVLPSELEDFSPEALCAYIRHHLHDGDARVELGAPDDDSYPLQRDGRHLRVAALRAGETLRVEDVEWVRIVVSAWNVARSNHTTASRWRFTAVSPGRSRALDMARRAATTSLPVLLLGATGTGKEVLAQGIHDHSLQAAGPFVAVNCAGLAGPRLESDLFGHVRGAYTGAHTDSEGLVSAAAGGTLFLDEIGDMPPEVQSKVLRFLETETGDYRRMGETRVRHAQVRVIAATSRDLSHSGFRRDLYYRLAGVRIEIPSPSPDDVEAIARTLLRTAAARARTELSEHQMSWLASAASSHVWPGGVRELRQAIERCVQMRDPDLSWEANWKAVTRDARSSGTSPPVIETQVQPSAIGRLLSDVVFLSGARDVSGRSALAARLHMTYQGVDSRLTALGVEIGDAEGLDRCLSERIAELRSVVASSPGLATLFKLATG